MSSTQGDSAPGSGDGTRPGNGKNGKVDCELLTKAENHRFGIAVLLISVFAVALLFSLNPSYATQPSVIISAFGGWIAAVITFFFTGQTVDVAHKNAAEAKSDEKITKNNAKRVLEELSKKKNEAKRQLYTALEKKDKVDIAGDLAAMKKNLEEWDVALEAAMIQLM